ncbi:helix-turn-helix transcriptional regulator [Bacillus cereus]|uniref:Helix-turn-helix transcriptional regulator n=1 Tax=Bacillus cereus TaxID=1396 RepID=A0A9X9A6S9_BACCE|nr:helix-turn-helix transcriptional regulator [Bacillus cereus]
MKKNNNNLISPDQCKVVVALDMIIGKWKPLIIQHLLNKEPLRFNELRRLIPNITQRMLTLHLRELEEQDIIKRVVYPVVPPKVEYSLTEHGKTLEPVLHVMHEWGLDHLEHMRNK